MPLKKSVMIWISAWEFMRKMTKMSEITGYQEAREAADKWNRGLNASRKKHGLSIDDVVAMSPGNDPFWMTPGKILKAAWAQIIMDNIIKPHLRRINVGVPDSQKIKDIHLRDIHYILTGMNYSIWDRSETYQNSTAHWDLLITAFANARYLNMVDPILIRDNKNKYEKRTDYRSDWDFETRIERGKEDLNKTEVLELFTSWFEGLKNWHNHMGVHIEIWIEKDLALVELVAKKYKIDTVTGEGETSVTQVYKIINRIKKAAKPVRIGYIADCDVVGSNMSKAMARKMEFVIHMLERDGFDVKLTHLMLTPAQVEQYNLPTIPMKVSKSGAYETRKDDWMEARGLPGAVEINSFHALYPDEFKAILENFINSYYDSEIKDKVKDFNKEQTKYIEELLINNEKITKPLEKFLEVLIAAIDDIDWEDQESEYDADFDGLIEEHGEKDYSDRDEHYQWLLDTELDYGGQLDRYDEYEAGELDNPEEGLVVLRTQKRNEE